MNAHSPDPNFQRIVSLVVSDGLPESAVENRRGGVGRGIHSRVRKMKTTSHSVCSGFFWRW